MGGDGMGAGNMGGGGMPGISGGESGMGVSALNAKLALQMMMGRSPMQVAPPTAQIATCSLAGLLL